MTLRLPRLAVALAACSLVLGACSDDGGEDADGRDLESTTTAPPTSTTTPEVTTTTIPPCPDVAAEEGGEAPQETAADVDGDGRDDQLVSYRTGGDAWRLEVELARGGGAALDLASFGGAVGVMGGSDLDGDGAAEIWARTGAGASTTIVSPFSVEGCDLAQVTFSTGEPAELPVGGSVGTASGVECTDDGQLLAFTASYTGDGTTETYQVTTVAYRLEDGVLAEQERSATEVLANDPEFLRYTSFDCGPVTL
ncbi:MAG TPA: VCBS repeat-containing protein [Acidimicrobiales bacterium]